MGTGASARRIHQLVDTPVVTATAAPDPICVETELLKWDAIMHAFESGVPIPEHTDTGAASTSTGDTIVTLEQKESALAKLEAQLHSLQQDIEAHRKEEFDAGHTAETEEKVAEGVTAAEDAMAQEAVADDAVADEGMEDVGIQKDLRQGSLREYE